jgi:myosin heavy subunit
MQLVNFPMISTLYLKFFSSSNCISESSLALEPLNLQKSFETTLQVTFSEDLGTPEKFRPAEDPNTGKEAGSFKVSVEKEDCEVKNCQLCPIFQNFTTVSEHALEIVDEMSTKIEAKAFRRIDELGMEMHDMDGDQVSAFKVKNLICLIMGLNEKLKVLDLYKERNANFMSQALDEQKSRENMQNAFKKTCNEVKELTNQLDRMAKALERQLKFLKARNIELEAVERIHKDYRINKDLEGDVLRSQILLATENKASPEANQLIITLKANSEFMEQSNKMMKNEFEKITKGSELMIKDLQEQISELSSDNLNLNLQADKINRLNKELKTQNESLLNESALLKSTLKEYECKMMYFKELEEQIKILDSQLTEKKEDYKTLQEQIEKLSIRYHEGSRGLFNDKRQLTATNKSLSDENAELKQKVFELQAQLSEIASKTISTSPGSPNSNFGRLTVQNLNLLKESKQLCEIFNKHEIDLLNEFDLVVKTILQNSTKHLMLQRLQAHLLVFFRNSNLENQALRGLVTGLQKDKPIYIPMRGDLIDNALANYLNSLEIKLEVPFIRLESGIYLFGSRRVALRVENIGIVSNFHLVRIGGGYIKIDDFIKNNVGFEMGKLKERESKSMIAEKYTKEVDINEDPDSPILPFQRLSLSSPNSIKKTNSTLTSGRLSNVSLESKKKAKW